MGVRPRFMAEIIAHRGANREAPENTLAAFERALDYICGFDGVWKATGEEIARHFLAAQRAG